MLAMMLNADGATIAQSYQSAAAAAAAAAAANIPPLALSLLRTHQ